LKIRPKQNLDVFTSESHMGTHFGLTQVTLGEECGGEGRESERHEADPFLRSVQ
jgi:hypothetical protein